MSKHGISGSCALEQGSCAPFSLALVQAGDVHGVILVGVEVLEVPGLARVPPPPPRRGVLIAAFPPGGIPAGLVLGALEA